MLEVPYAKDKIQTEKVKTFYSKSVLALTWSSRNLKAISNGNCELDQTQVANHGSRKRVSRGHARTNRSLKPKAQPLGQMRQKATE